MLVGEAEKVWGEAVVATTGVPQCHKAARMLGVAAKLRY